MCICRHGRVIGTQQGPVAFTGLKEAGSHQQAQRNLLGLGGVADMSGSSAPGSYTYEQFNWRAFCSMTVIVLAALS